MTDRCLLCGSGHDISGDGRCVVCRATRLDPPTGLCPALGDPVAYRGAQAVVVARFRVDGRDRVRVRYDADGANQHIDVASLDQPPAEPQMSLF